MSQSNPLYTTELLPGIGKLHYCSFLRTVAFGLIELPSGDLFLLFASSCSRRVLEQRKGSALSACEQAGNLLHNKPMPLNPKPQVSAAGGFFTIKT